MKKRLLLLTVLVMALVCMLAISASATAIPTFGAVEKIDTDAMADGVQEISISSHLNTVVTDGASPSASARVILTCTCEAGRHTYPTYYITKKDAGNYIWFNFTDINSYNPCKATYSATNILAIEIPNGITVMTYCLKGNTTVQFLDMSTALTMTCVETGSGYNAVSNCTSLIEARIPASMTQIKGHCFFGCTSLERFIIPEDSQLTYIGAYSFGGCTALSAFYLPPKLVTIGSSSGTAQGVFNACTSIYFVNEPVTPTYTPAKPSIYYFPSTLETIFGEEFKNCKSLNDTFVFPESMTAVSNRWAFYGSPFVNAVFLGDMTEVGAQYWGCSMIFLANKADLAISNVATFTNPSGAKVYCCNASTNTTHLVEKNLGTEATCITNQYLKTYCFCGALIEDKEIADTKTGIHTWVTNDCTVSVMCKGDENCDEMSPANENHALVNTLVYANGFDKVGVYNCYCTVDNCTMADKEIRDGEKAPIITFKGYSNPETEAYLGINVGYSVNTVLLDEYIEVTGESVTIGLFMVNGDIDVADIIDGKTLELADGAKGFSVKVVNLNYSSISIEVRGFSKTGATEGSLGNYYTLKLVSAVVVTTTKGENTATHFIQAGVDGADLETKTFNGFDFYLITADAVYGTPEAEV